MNNPLSIEQAATLLNVRMSYLRLLIKSGELMLTDGKLDRSQVLKWKERKNSKQWDN